MQYTKNTYPDGGNYVSVSDINPKDNHFTFRINNYEDLFLLRSIKDAFENSKLVQGFANATLNVTIPCLFQQQHDRRFKEHESHELKLVCEFINNCKFDRVTVFHPHNESAVEMGINNVRITNNTSFVESAFLDTGRVEFGKFQGPILFSTDAGSFKWINKLAEGLEKRNSFKVDVYAANKMRDAETHKLVQVVECDDFKGRDILICDDLCVFGGTFVGLAKMLRKRNVGKLNLAVSHITVPNPNPELETLFDKIYTTNSKADAFSLKNIQIYRMF